jgi:hypothetical protein
LNDWNPSYSVELNHFNTTLDLDKGVAQSVINQLIEKHGKGLDYKSHYYPEERLLKVFLKGGSTILVDTSSGRGTAEFLKEELCFMK